MTYTVLSNGGAPHAVVAETDREALGFMKEHWREFIDSVLSSDMITLYNPDGYLLAYISTVTGEQTVKHWN